MIRSILGVRAPALVLPLALAIAAPAGDKDKPGGKEVKKGGGKKEFSVQGQIVLPKHVVRMEKGVLYIIEAHGKGFPPQITIPDGFAKLLPDFSDPNVTKVEFNPTQSKEYRVIVLPVAYASGLPSGKLEYTLTVRPVSLGKPFLIETVKLTEKDMKYGTRESYYKAYPVKLKAGTAYVIDLAHDPKDLKTDPYLYLEDDSKKVVAQDDDSGGDLNARISYTPKQDGEYRVIATTLRPTVCEMTLTVRAAGGGASPKDVINQKDEKPPKD